MVLPALCFALVAPASGGFHSLNERQLPADKAEFTFAVIGDNRPAGAGLPPTATFRRLMADIGMIGPAFVISSGDLVYGHEESLEQFKKECAEVKPIIDALPCPFYNSPGNHELAERQEFQDAYEAAFGDIRGAFTFGGWRFVAACSDAVGFANSFSPTDTALLEKELAFAGPKVVFSHHPLYARASNTEDGHTIKDADKWRAAFAASHVTAVFEGHDHVMNHQTHDGVDYWISGGGGAPLDTSPDDGGYHHFLIVHVKDGKFKVDIIPEGALEIESRPGHTTVANYTRVDLPLNNLKMKLSGPGAKLHAYVDNKGKRKAVEASVSAYDGKTGLATVSVVATKARKTVIEE